MVPLWGYVLATASAFVVSLTATWLVRQVALRWQVVDTPNKPRKIHRQPIPLLGGVAVWIGLAVTIGWCMAATPWLVGHNLSLKSMVAFVIGGLVLVIIGALDDRFDLPPAVQLLGPIVAVLIMLVGGVGIDKLTNPLGGFVFLNQFELTLFWLGDIPATVTLWADAFTVVWLFGMMYTVKLLDGIDGLVGGIGVIGSLIVFLLSMITQWYQPDTALLALIIAGAAGGFLVWNFHPAKIFGGEGGALLIGFCLGVISIIAGGKIATALLIMALPILDVVWVIGRRWLVEKKNPFTHADRKHLHFRLLDAGLSQRQVVLFFYASAAAFGILGLFLQSQQKLVALIFTVLMMIVVAIWLIRHTNRQQS